MRVDIYRRPEAEGKFSHLAVPEGQPIPEEATNIDWQPEAKAQDLDASSTRWDDYGIAQPLEQIRKKGYAITSLNAMTD